MIISCFKEIKRFFDFLYFEILGDFGIGKQGIFEYDILGEDIIFLILKEKSQIDRIWFNYIFVIFIKEFWEKND